MNTTEATTATTCQQLTARGWAIESTTPLPKAEGDWPCLSYQCRLTLNGREVWAGPYKLGVGHVKFPTKFEAYPRHTPERLVPVLNTLRMNPWANLKNKLEHAQAAQVLAVDQKVSPKLSDVLHSLLSDSSDTDQDFSDWAAGLGYDSDSIKARDIYDACQAIARTLRRNLPKGEREAVEAILADY